MARNLSAEQFKQLLANIPQAVAKDMQASLNEAADDLVGWLKQTVPLGKDGRHELKASVRREEGKKPLQARVMAGGDLTTKPVGKGSGDSYDYANAIEFGTKNMPAEPFFWPTYRLRKRAMRAKIARQMKAAISKIVPLT